MSQGAPGGHSIPPRSLGQVQQGAGRSYVFRRLVLPAQRFIHTEVLSGVVLLVAAVIALIWANSPWDGEYFDLFESHLVLDGGLFKIDEDVHHWINDGLMTIFFFVVGLEIKREMVKGELAGFQKALLPAVAAIGGMVFPALLFTTLNAGGEGGHGWGVPMATDIAFALGVLALVGSRIPSPVRIFLLALAIVDDIGAILVIAIFYTGDLSIEALAIAGALFVIVYWMNRLGVQDINVYFLIGAVIWVAMHESGVHATIAGVVLGLMTPADPYYSRATFEEPMAELMAKFREAEARGDDLAAEQILGQMEALTGGTEPPLDRLERLLHPMTSFIIVPIFALANAGVIITGDSINDAVSSEVSQGVALGLLLGKPLGIFLATWLIVQLGISRLPSGMRWGHVIGIGLLGGVGFTVALFVNELAFDEEILINDGKMGILAGSITSAVIGLLMLTLITRSDRPTAEPAPGVLEAD
jgi:NhaA family Na+:H+ antiporter